MEEVWILVFQPVICSGSQRGNLKSFPNLLAGWAEGVVKERKGVTIYGNIVEYARYCS